MPNSRVALLSGAYKHPEQECDDPTLGPREDRGTENQVAAPEYRDPSRNYTDPGRAF